MSNGWPPILQDGKVLKGRKKLKTPLLTAFAEGCDPGVDDFEDWWPIHNAIDRGNDFCFTVPIAALLQPLSTAQSQIVIVVTNESTDVYGDRQFAKTSVA